MQLMLHPTYDDESENSEATGRMEILVSLEMVLNPKYMNEDEMHGGLVSNSL